MSLLSITPTSVVIGDFNTAKRYIRHKSAEAGSFPVPKGATVFLEADSAGDYTNWRYSQGIGMYSVNSGLVGEALATGDPDFSLVYPDE